MRRASMTRRRRRAPDPTQLYLDFEPSGETPRSAEAVLDLLLARVNARVGDFDPAQFPEDLANAMRVTVERCPMSTFGQLLYDKRRPVILVNDNIEWRVQRFTLAHELAHLLVIRACHDCPNGDVLTHVLAQQGYSRQIERFIDALAACILFPLEAFAREAEALDAAGVRGFPVAWQLSGRFRASLTATLRRLADVRTDYLALGCRWRATARKPENLRIDWQVGTPSRSGFVPRHKGMPTEGPIAHAYWRRHHAAAFMEVVASGQPNRVLYLEATPTHNGALVLVDLRTRADAPPAMDVERLVLSGPRQPGRETEPPALACDQGFPSNRSAAPAKARGPRLAPMRLSA